MYGHHNDLAYQLSDNLLRGGFCFQQVGPLMTLTSLHCQCDHLSVFSGGVFVIPNTVEPIGDAPLFLTVFSNPLIVTVAAAVWILYFQLMLWADTVDNRDSKKVCMWFCVCKCSVCVLYSFYFIFLN